MALCLTNEALLAALAKSLLIAGMAASFRPSLAFDCHSLCTLWPFSRPLATQRPCISTSCYPRGGDGSVHAASLHRMEQLLGWPTGRGLDTIIIAHATFGMCFAAVVIQARLRQFDRSLEEAAMDLVRDSLMSFSQ